MLGEGARSAEDATRYFDSYVQAIRTVAARNSAGPEPPATAISVKLSALHPRFEEMKRTRVFAELLPRVRSLALLARDGTVGLTLDAEESERLELTLDLTERSRGILSSPAGTGSVSRCRPTRSARLPSATGSSLWREAHAGDSRCAW